MAERGLVLYLGRKPWGITLQRRPTPSPYGARNLRRTIQRDLEDPIARAIIDSFESPISALRAVVREGKLELEKE